MILAVWKRSAPANRLLTGEAEVLAGNIIIKELNNKTQKIRIVPWRLFFHPFM
jgi:hypothetical protein